MKVCVTGGTGLIGRRLCAALQGRGDEVTVITRDPLKARDLGDVAVVAVDPTAEGSWQEVVRESDAVVNLAGENLAGRRWTERVKRAIEESRVLTTTFVAEAIASSGSRIPLISASAVGYYGTQAGDAALDERAPAGHDFLAHVCADWERACQPALDAGARVVNTRFGVVLAREGGALARMVPPFRFYLGGTVGSGEQWVSWVHIRDVVRVLLRALDDERFEGPVNVCSPNPVRMRELAAAIGRVLHRPAFFRVPAAALRVAFGEAATVLLEGQRVVPRRLQELGFELELPGLDAALQDLLVPGARERMNLQPTRAY